MKNKISKKTIIRIIKEAIISNAKVDQEINQETYMLDGKAVTAKEAAAYLEKMTKKLNDSDFIRA